MYVDLPGCKCKLKTGKTVQQTVYTPNELYVGKNETERAAFLLETKQIPSNKTMNDRLMQTTVPPDAMLNSYSLASTYIYWLDRFTVIVSQC